MKRRITALFLSMALLCAILPTALFSASAATSGTCGENLTWSFDEATGTLTISGSGKMTNYEPFQAPWRVLGDIWEVKLPNGLTSVGDFAFDSCCTLMDVTIPDSVTSIGVCAFTSCSLTSVKIPNGVTSIGEQAFFGCGMTEVTIPDSVTSIGNAAFSGCFNLERITVVKGNSSYSSDENGVLFNKDKTELICCPGGYSGSYIIPDGVTSVSFYAFGYCGALTGVTIPSTVINIDGLAFYSCPSLASVSIPEGVASIGEMAFEFCDSLTNVVIPSSVTNIGAQAFFDCSNLKAAYFFGDAPELGQRVFSAYTDTWEYNNIPGLTLYYIEGKEGWTTPTWNGYPTAIWDPAEHTHSYDAVITAPTCTEKGYTTHTCACGDSYMDSYTDALGHNYVNGVCSRCGEKDPNYVPPVKPDVEFTDVKTTDWYCSAVNFAVSNNLFNGMGNNKFEPGTAMNRAMLVTVLWRYAGSPKEGTNTFTDVKTGQWYTDAVAWASSNSIVGGVGGGKFDPNGNVTREQLAAILFRYCDYKEIGTDKRGDLSTFPDKARVSSWATAAYSWAVGEGLIGGNQINGQTLLDPQGNATRAQVATILMRFIENVVK